VVRVLSQSNGLAASANSNLIVMWAILETGILDTQAIMGSGEF
jgi:hypothetical protein